MAGRILAIGDIHGCSAALASLTAAISPDASDTVVLLGDYIDRGPDSKGVLEQLLALCQRCRLVPLFGNHEEMFLAAFRNESVLDGWLACGGRETLASYRISAKRPIRTSMLVDLFPLEHLEFLVACRVHHETETHFFVHANYRPDLPSEALRWTYLDARTAQPHCSGKMAVVGHSVQRSGEVLDLGFLKCIDTFCDGGKWLTALDVVSGQIWQADMRGRIRVKRKIDVST